MNDICPCKMSEAHYRESLKAAKAQENPVVRENCIATTRSSFTQGVSRNTPSGIQS
jgi:hypothetical protein